MDYIKIDYLFWVFMFLSIISFTLWFTYLFITSDAYTCSLIGCEFTKINNVTNPNEICITLNESTLKQLN